MRSYSIEAWVDELRGLIQENEPNLISLFDTYSAEAIFGFNYIASDLATLPIESRVLEVGSGAMILSCYLVHQGFNVYALEPIGTGFSHFSKLRALMLAFAKENDCLPVVIDSKVEELKEQDSFDYAFSVNVMEHIDNVELGLDRICDSIKDGAVYRFTCPNYLFPYEPHFNIPTLFSKKLTAAVFRERIEKNIYVQDPIGAWQSLNWITPLVVQKYARVKGVGLKFNRKFLQSTLERVGSDKQFAQRRSKLMRVLVSGTVALGVHRILALIPLVFQPSMDCRIIKYKVGCQ